jgi:hypothetical protein
MFYMLAGNLLFLRGTAYLFKKACSVLILQALFSMILAGDGEAGWSDWFI